jgi:hypothetical protein
MADTTKLTEEQKAMQAAAKAAGVTPNESNPVGDRVAQMGAAAASSSASPSDAGFRNIFRPYNDPSQGAPLAQFGKDVAYDAGLFGTRLKNILTTGDPGGRSPVTATQRPQEAVGPVTTAVGNPNNLAIASRSGDTPAQSAINATEALSNYNASLRSGEMPLSPPPLNGAVTTRLPGGGSVTTYQKGTHPSEAQIAGIPFRDAPAYGEQNVRGPIPSGMGVGKMNNMDSDIANQRLAADMKSKGILNPGSPAYLINEQINSAIRENRPFGNLLSQYDRASNRAPIPSADPNIVPGTQVADPLNPGKNLPEGTAFNKATGEILTNAAAAPIESPMQKLLSTPTEKPGQTREQNQADAREQARQIATERLRTTNPAQDALVKWDAGNVQRYENFKNGISNSSDPNVVASEKARRDQYAAKQAMERATADQPNGDPLRDTQIAVNQAEAAKQMALANGATQDQINKDPSIAGRYLRNPNGFNALGSDGKTNQLAMEHLRGATMRELVQQAVDRNIGGSQTSLNQNRRAIDQNSKQAMIDERAEKADDRKTALKIAQGNAADRQIAGLQRRMDTVDKDIEKNNLDKGDIAKKAGAEKNLKELEKKKKTLQAQLDVLSGLEPEVDSESAGGIIPQPTPLPPADQRKDGEVYTNANGKRARWNEQTKTFIPV